MDAVRGRMIWVCEDHQTGSDQPINKLVDISLDGSRPQRTLVSGNDFYAAPRLSPEIRGSLGSNGVTLTCRGTARSCGSAIAPRTARSPRRKS